MSNGRNRVWDYFTYLLYTVDDVLLYYLLETLIATNLSQRVRFICYQDCSENYGQICMKFRETYALRQEKMRLDNGDNLIMGMI